jgi:hypothetical protein
MSWPVDWSRAASYWPTVQQTRLLQAGLRAGREALDAWERVEPGLDVNVADPATRRLLPLVYVNLQRHAPDAARLADLRPLYHATWRTNRQLVQRGRALLQALARAGVDAVALKGLALICTCYPDVGARPMGDIDLLVARAQLGAAADVLHASGWTPPSVLTSGFVEVFHAAPFRRETGEECDLHWRIFPEPTDVALDDACRARAIRVDVDGDPMRTLDPTDQLLHVCMHGARWAPVPAIRWIADAVTILRVAAIDWARFVAEARVRRFALRARDALCYVAAVMGAPIPASTLRQLSETPTSALERLEHRINSREHALLGTLPVYWCHYLRARRAAYLRPLGFARYLQHAWSLRSVCDIPRRAVVLAARRFAAWPAV